MCRLSREKWVAMFSSERNCLRKGSLGRDGETGRLGYSHEQESDGDLK